MQSIKSVAGTDKLLDRISLLLGDPRLGLGIRIAWNIFQISFIVRISIRPEITVGPDHSIAQAQEKSIVLEQISGDVVIVNGVIDRNIQVLEGLVESHANIVGVVVAI